MCRWGWGPLPVLFLTKISCSLHFRRSQITATFPPPPPRPAKLCGRHGGWAGRESDIAFPASSRVRGWPSQGTEVAQDPCPFLPSVLSSGQASGCGVDLGESVFFLITVGRSPEPERSMGGSRHVGTEATMPQCPAEDSS